MIAHGENEIQKMFFSDIGIKRVYFGEEMIYERKTSYIYINVKGFEEEPQPTPAIVGEAVVGEAKIGTESIAMIGSASVGQTIVG